MKIKILRSLIIIISLLSIACITTYAVFTASPVTVANNTISTGSVNSALCDKADGNWKSSIVNSFSIRHLIPGEENEQELTADKNIYVGNDGGNLISEITCPHYAGTSGHSDISLRFIPKVNFTSCTEEARDSIRLDFDMGEILRSGYKTLREWSANGDPEGPVYQVNQARNIKVYAALDINSQMQNTTCQFDLMFQGVQATEES